jgi:hypothetical protein
MPEQLEMRVFEMTGTGVCVASDDGQVVYEQIAAALRAGHAVLLSFANVDALTSAFLNAAIGQLYGEFGEDEIREGLLVSDMAQQDLVLLKRVVETAKAYFKDHDRFVAARAEVLEEDHE